MSEGEESLDLPSIVMLVTYPDTIFVIRLLLGRLESEGRSGIILNSALGNDSGKRPEGQTWP